MSLLLLLAIHHQLVIAKANISMKRFWWYILPTPESTHTSLTKL